MTGKGRLFGAFGIVAALVGGYFFLESLKDGGSTDTSITVPDLSVQAQAGERAFGQNCVACHGKNAGGSEQGPPLIHNIYNPGHHSDQAFYMAVQNGVRSHHWPYGNMPPLRHVQPKMVADIITYVREVQKANGIVYQQHRM